MTVRGDTEMFGLSNPVSHHVVGVSKFTTLLIPLSNMYRSCLNNYTLFILKIFQEIHKTREDKEIIRSQMHPDILLSGVLIQKYIEHPLIVHGRKFDIRQWIMVTSLNPLEVWIYDESYIRFSCEKFDLDNLSDYIHLTNHCHYLDYNIT